MQTLECKKLGFLSIMLHGLSEFWKNALQLFVQLVSKISNLCDPHPSTLQTDGQIDRQTTCDRKTALCAVVHCAVKT